MIVPTAAIIATFLLFVILPQQNFKQQQQHMLKKITLGARVTTMHGISGNISSCESHFIIIACDDGRKIEVLRQTIASINHEKA